MNFIRRHWRGIFVSSLLAVPLAASGIAYWSASEIASPSRRALMPYHREFLMAPAEHGISLTPFALEDKTPCLLCAPLPSGQLGSRGLKIRQDLASKKIDLPPPGEIIGTIVLVHGRKGRKEDYLPIAERLCAVGFRCLLLDLPAHGDNASTVATYGIHEADLPSRLLETAAKRFNFDPSPASLFGMSMGGSVAIHSCAHADAPWQSLVVIASFDDFSSVLKDNAVSHAGEALGTCWFQATDFLYQGKTHLSTTSVRPAAIASSLQLPTLLAHGTADQTISLAAGKRLFDAFPGSKRWIEVPGAGHDNVLVTDFPIYAEIATWYLNHTERPQHSASIR